MKKIFVLLFLGSLENMCVAQIPYFAKTVGQNRMYAYTSMKVRPGINSQESYTTFQYGLSKSLATDLDLCTSNGNSYWGAWMRYGACLSKENKLYLDGFKPLDKFDALHEVGDFYEFVKTKKVSICQWIKELKNSKCLFLYNAKDLASFRNYIFQKIKKKLC